MKIKKITVKSLPNSFVKKNIVRFCFIIVFAIAFGSCTKYKTWSGEVKIVSTSVSEVGFTTAKLTIVLGGNRWLIDNCGFNIQGYADWDNLTCYWYEDFEYMEQRVHCEIDGLLPGMTYNWRPYIQKDTITVYGEYLIFTTDM